MGLAVAVVPAALAIGLMQIGIRLGCETDIGGVSCIYGSDTARTFYNLGATLIFLIFITVPLGLGLTVVGFITRITRRDK